MLLGFLKLCYVFALAIEIRSYDALLLSFRNYPYASCKQFTWWTHSRLGKGIRKVAPSCVVRSIRKNYPSENGVYIDFRQAENNFKATLVTKQFWYIILRDQRILSCLRSFLFSGKFIISNITQITLYQ